MATLVDARGLACPRPVILTRNALQENDVVTTIVDSATAQQNVTRMAEKAGCVIAADARRDGIYLEIRRRSAAQPVLRTAEAPRNGPLVLLVPSEFMGHGDEALGHILVRSFFHALGETRPLPDTVIFLNSGVRLVVTGSPVLDDLKTLCEDGVIVLACGTCLGHYGLKDELGVGEISNMYDIAEALLNAGRVIRL